MSTTDPITDFLASRADWIAQGRPADHPYIVEAKAKATAEHTRTGPLVVGITDEHVAAAARLTPPPLVVQSDGRGGVRWVAPTD